MIDRLPLAKGRLTAADSVRGAAASRWLLRKEMVSGKREAEKRGARGIIIGERGGAAGGEGFCRAQREAACSLRGEGESHSEC